MMQLQTISTLKLLGIRYCSKWLRHIWAQIPVNYLYIANVLNSLLNLTRAMNNGYASAQI